MNAQVILIIAIIIAIAVVFILTIRARNKKMKDSFIHPEAKPSVLVQDIDFSQFHVYHKCRDGVERTVYFTKATNGPHKGEWTTYCLRGDLYKPYRSYFKQEKTAEFIQELLKKLGDKMNIDC